MLNEKQRKEALAIRERAVNKYNDEYRKMEGLGNQLYKKRMDSVALIHEIEGLVNSIANRPKEFDKKISQIRVAQARFGETKDYAAKAIHAAIASGAGAVAGITGGMAIAGMAPTASMWVATTFGTASTGTAISTLRGAAATKAALAWLGRGALSAGGAGIAGGQAFLALAGPIGWGFTGVTLTASACSLGYKNKKIAHEAIAEAKEITVAGAELNEMSEKIRYLMDETVMLSDKLREAAAENMSLKGTDYQNLSQGEQYRLGTMVNNTLSLAELLNKTL